MDRAYRLLVILLSVVLATIFIAAGVGKLIDPGLPEHFLGGPLAFLRALGRIPIYVVAIGEIAAGVTVLVFTRLRVIGCAAMEVLCFAFAWVIVSNAGHEAFLQDCGCFGPLMTSPHGTNATASLLLLLSQACCLGFGAALLRRGSGAQAAVGMGRLVLPWIALFGVVGVVGLSVRLDSSQHDLQSAKQLHLRSQDLGIPLHADRFQPLDGGVGVAVEGSTRPVTVIFFSTKCGHCRNHARLWNEMRAIWRRDGEELILAAADSMDDTRAFCRETSLAEAGVCRVDQKVLEFYGVSSFPEILRFNSGHFLTWRSSVSASDGSLVWWSSLYRADASTFSSLMATLLTLGGAIPRSSTVRAVPMRPGEFLCFEVVEDAHVTALGSLVEVSSTVPVAGLGTVQFVRLRPTGGGQAEAISISTLRVYGKEIDHLDAVYRAIARGAPMADIASGRRELVLAESLLRNVKAALAQPEAGAGVGEAAKRALGSAALAR